MAQTNLFWWFMTNNLQNNRLAQIKARLTAATPGPWKAYNENEPPYGALWCVANELYHNPKSDDDRALGLQLECGTKEDAELIANAPTDLAWLIERCEKLEAVADAAKGWRDCNSYREDEYASLLLRALAALESDGEG